MPDTKPENPPAFPPQDRVIVCAGAVDDNFLKAVEDAMGRQRHLGMTLRDYFAAKAMAAAITTSAAPYLLPDQSHIETHIAEMAHGVADAMLAKRSEQ